MQKKCIKSSLKKSKGIEFKVAKNLTNLADCMSVKIKVYKFIKKLKTDRST